MKYRLFAVAAAAFLHLACGTLGEKLNFRVKVADVQHKANSFLQHKEPADYVEITLPGKMLNPPLPVKLISRHQADWSTPEHAAASILSANAAGDIAWVVQNYVPAERQAIGQRLSDPVTVDGTKNYYRSLGTASITGRTEILGFTLLFVQGVDEDGDSAVLVVTLSKTPEGWKQTEALAHDDTFEIVWTALHTGGVR